MIMNIFLAVVVTSWTIWVMMDILNELKKLRKSYDEERD